MKILTLAISLMTPLAEAPLPQGMVANPGPSSPVPAVLRSASSKKCRRWNERGYA